jgi:phage terminase large subunit-like protein
MITATIDSLTREWIRNASDEKAALNGCRFDGERGQFVVDWIQKCCVLYEGERAGQPMILDDWQYEVTMRLFGWVRWSSDWNREVRRFRRASIWIPKKNGKSPTLAAWGLYLFCGDGEQGQKVYSTAKDGRQAMISHTHALEMVRRSPRLERQCSINKSTNQITHEPTRSFYRIVAGDNINSQEGLNGSVMVDETHVVDRRLMKVLRGAGISRSEPLQIEVSTAGNNPDGYGKSQFDYGTKVAEGTLDDQEFFFQSYAAPQDIGDAELDERIVEIGKAANPTWGRIVREGEFLAEYNRSKVSISDLADFKMYRLNIWQSAANPWLRSGDWASCKQQFADEQLAGMECYAGLDLSKTRDMSALVLAFPEGDEVVKLLPYFFLPEETARKYNHLAPFLQWEADGFLTLTPGDVIDYGFIKARFRKLAKQFQILKMGYDKTYAEELTQTLEQGQTNDNGDIIEEGTGVERMELGQSIMQFANPTEEFERLVISGKLHHNGNPILTWQAGHAQCRRDANGNKKPVKPTPDDIKKVDGIIAGIMAVHVAQRSVGGYYQSMYDEPGALYG